MNSEINGVLEAIDFSRLSMSLFIIFVGFVVAKFIKASSNNLIRTFPDWRLRVEQIITIINFIIIIGSSALGVFFLFRSKEAAFTIGGSLGLAFAIGAKDLAASLLSGITVMFDRSFQVGDRIKFGDIYGDVLSIGVRSTRLRTLDDSIVTIPNSQFMNNPVSSSNAGALDMQVEIDIHVDPSADLKEVKKIVREVAVASRYVYLEKPIVILFKDVFAERVYCTRVRLKCYVIETLYEKSLESDIIERCHSAFWEKGIRFPGAGH